MNRQSFHFRVYSPPKGLLLILTIIGASFPIFWCMDTYGPDWMKHREIRILLVTAALGFPSYLLAKWTTSQMVAHIDYDGLWIEHYPTWHWNKYDHLHIGWLELDHWYFKKGVTGGHDISWDRLILKPSHGTRFMILPTYDFDPQTEFPDFLANLERATTEFNERSSTHIPIQYGLPVRRTLLKAWILVIFSTACFGLTALAGYIMITTEEKPAWLIGGIFFLLIAFGFQIWKQAKIIRNNTQI